MPPIGELLDGRKGGVGAVGVDEIGERLNACPAGACAAWSCSSAREPKRELGMIGATAVSAANCCRPCGCETRWPLESGRMTWATAPMLGGAATRWGSRDRRSRWDAVGAGQADCCGALKPRCIATIPPVRLRQATFVQPTSRSRSARVGWSGQSRMESAR